MPFVVEWKTRRSIARRAFSAADQTWQSASSSSRDVRRDSKAANTLEATYTTQVQTHVSLETHGAVAFNATGDELTVWCSTQGIFAVRDDLAVFFNLPPDKVRVISEYLGGGFGSKFGATPGVMIAAPGRESGRPVKLMLPRGDEHLATGNRPSSMQQVRIGVDATAS